MPGLLSDMFADGGQQQSSEFVAEADIGLDIEADTSYEMTMSDGDGGSTTYSGGQSLDVEVGVQALLGASSDNGVVYDVDGT